MYVDRYTGDKILMTYRRQADGAPYVAFENTYTALWKVWIYLYV